MSAKLALLFKSKIAMAIVGAVVLGGGGSAAALAASGHAIQLPLIPQAQSTQHVSDGSTGDHSNAQGDKDNDGDKAQANDSSDNGEHEAQGKIASIDAGHSGFVLTTDKGTVAVAANDKTVFDGHIQSFSDLKVGMSVEVEGNLQSDGSLIASRVHGEDENTSDSNDGQSSTNSGDSGSSTGGDNHSGSAGSGAPTPDH